MGARRSISMADVDSYLALVRHHVEKLIIEQVEDMGSAKVQLSTWIIWKKKIMLALQPDAEDGIADVQHANIDQYARVEKVFNSRLLQVFQDSDVNELLDNMFAQIRVYVENPALPQSGFTIDRIIHMDTDFHKLQLTRDSSYIKLPKWISAKKAIINQKNDDEECFKWSVIAALHHEKIGIDVQRISKLQQYADQYNWEGLEFPLDIKKIIKFENNNPKIAVNVLYTSKTSSINILQRSDYNAPRENQVNLLLITDDEKMHYTCIKNLSRILGRGNSKDHKAMHFFLNCLEAFNYVESRDKHYKYSTNHEAVKNIMPKENEKLLKYADGHMQFKVPFAIYADFESLLIPVEDRKESKTIKLNKHVPSGWCTYGTFPYGSVPDPLTTYRGKDCVEKFIGHLKNEVKRLYNTFPEKTMVITPEEENEHNNASECHICMKPFNDPENNRKVRDHCHYTGLCRGAAHNNCSLAYKIPGHIPIIFHNLSVYDAHPSSGSLEKKYNAQDIEHRFIDSFRFMASSFDKLSSNLPDGQCKNFRQFYQEDDIFKLMRRKGVYPYEYIERFEESELPPKGSIS
ncbi:uncharacterized protein LOC130657785 [Hydractinia symbiolongicarpus]|uniref:uncharacterized protein LOC130657785 n=1 Tax=Hydractinia symbiolongicarpus TaxID=13093 RepID=UPI0025508E24|nr:uncharacterized protein LOC130657785 [Hydractinia symbiolongicarpus]